MLCARCGTSKQGKARLCFRGAHLKLSRFGTAQMPRIWKANKRTRWKLAKPACAPRLKKWIGNEEKKDSL